MALDGDDDIFWSFLSRCCGGDALCGFHASTGVLERDRLIGHDGGADDVALLRWKKEKSKLN